MERTRRPFHRNCSGRQLTRASALDGKAGLPRHVVTISITGPPRHTFLVHGLGGRMALAEVELTHAYRHVLQVLIDGRASGQWFTRYEAAETAGVSSRTALRALLKMESLGWLDVEHVRDQEYGINTPTRYTLRNDAPV